MINELEVPLYLHIAVPEIDDEISKAKKQNAYKMMQSLAAFTAQRIKSGDFRTALQCFNVAEKLYNRGNTVVKNAVENVYVYSFTSLFNSFPGYKKQIASLIPIGIYSVYVEQLSHGC